MIPRDKALHFGAGFLITLVFGFLINPVVGFFLAFVAGVGKELYDFEVQNEEFSVPDMLVTWAGGIIPLILLNVISQ
jgi:hypothetical protein